jgi:hypothetical protein
MTGRLTELKAANIAKRDGFRITGYVLTHEDGRKCIVDMSAVRWLDRDEFWRLMHPTPRRPEGPA